VPVLQGRQYLLVHVERASDILQVLALPREFPALKIVLVGASEGWTVADRIARARVPVIASAVNDLPASFEQLAATQSNVGRMRALNSSSFSTPPFSGRNCHWLRNSAVSLM